MPSGIPTHSGRRVNPEQLGKRIRQIRKAHNLSQRKLAKQLGISQTLVGFFERGQRRVPINILLEVSILGDVSLNWLVTGHEFKAGKKK
ncbi:helix-turn-helix domain-containing protein [candidate division KSB1 bacterium]